MLPKGQVLQVEALPQLGTCQGLGWAGSITHPGKQEQCGPGMMGQRGQGEELARGRF